MANTGYFCILFDNPCDATVIRAKFLELVEKTPSLKNLSIHSTPDWDLLYSRALTVTCDNLCPYQVRALFDGEIPEGIQAFMINSVFGDDWEKVQ